MQELLTCCMIFPAARKVLSKTFEAHRLKGVALTDNIRVVRRRMLLQVVDIHSIIST